MSLSKFSRAWEKLNVPPHISEWIKEGVYIPFKQPPQECDLPNHKLNKEEESFIDKKVNELLTNSYISKVIQKPVCVTPIGCVKKKSADKFRLINDMRIVNQYIDVPKVRYEDLSCLPDIVKENDWFGSVDLKDGFHNVKIKSQYRKYFGFKWNNNYYQWNVLNFGCAISPYLFTKILRPVVKYLRENNIRCVLYVDDFLVCSSELTINSDIKFVIKTLQELGWKINFEKSILIPTQSIEYLGLIIETCNNGTPVLKVPKSKINKLKKDIQRILKCENVTARVLAKLVGQCNFICRAILPGKLMLRNVHRLLRTKVTWETKLVLDTEARADLRWWIESMSAWNGKAILPSSVDGQLVTDASHIGWGGHFGEEVAYGTWNYHMSRQHSNVRELTAVLLCIKAMLPLLKDKTIQVLSDNITTVAYINHMGGPMDQLVQISKLIWKIALENNITILARHLAGKSNTRADELSRRHDKHEWMLSPAMFQLLDSVWGPHTIDRFASALTTQLPKYNSRFWDPNGMRIDAMAQTDWNAENNFVNPPIRFLGKILQIVQEQKAHATIVAPWWPAQAWFQTLRSLSISPPIRIYKRAIWKLNPAIPEPVRNRRWKLYAWRVCGNEAHLVEDGRLHRHRD